MYKKCPICNHKSVFYKNIKGNINIPLDKDVYTLNKCINCEHIFRVNLLNKHIYTDNYYAYNADEMRYFPLVKFFFTRQNIFPFNIFWKIIENNTRYLNVLYIENDT